MRAQQIRSDLSRISDAKCSLKIPHRGSMRVMAILRQSTLNPSPTKSKSAKLFRVNQSFNLYHSRVSSGVFLWVKGRVQLRESRLQNLSYPHQAYVGKL